MAQSRRSVPVKVHPLFRELYLDNDPNDSDGKERRVRGRRKALLPKRVNRRA
jgi:hypothetical protein